MGVDYTTALVSTDWEQCLHPRKWRAGYRSGKQLWICAVCHQTWVSPRTNRTREQMIRELLMYYKAGVNVSKTARIGKFNDKVVRYFFRQFYKRLPEQLCECGRPVFHIGNCKGTRKCTTS